MNHSDCLIKGFESIFESSQEQVRALNLVFVLNLRLKGHLALPSTHRVIHLVLAQNINHCLNPILITLTSFVVFAQNLPAAPLNGF